LRGLREGLDSAKQNPSTSQLVSDFITNVYFPKMQTVNPATGTAPLKDSTLFGYRHVYNRHVKPNLNGEKMRQMDMSVARKLLERIATATKLSSRSLSHIKWFLKAVFDVAKVENAFDSNLVNPFAEVKIPKTGVYSKPSRHATLDEVLDMMAALDDTSATVVALAAFSGLRKEEIQGLQWRDIRDGQIHVERTAWRTTKVIEDTKTEASRDAVPVIPLLAQHLAAHRNGLPEGAHVFVAPKNASKNRPLDLHNLANRIIRPMLAAAGIPWCGWHGFRRGLATNLHTLGIPDIAIQRILRHADVAVTQRSYIKVEEGVRTAAMSRFSNVLKAKLAARGKAHSKRNKPRAE
jgi:integrase